MEYTHCIKCLTSRTGDVVGAPCRTSGCGGTIEPVPAYSDLVDVLPEKMTCGRRNEALFNGKPVEGRGPDNWHKFKKNGDRVCSYCGSLHPEDFLRLVKAASEAQVDAGYSDVVEIERSDKSYKVYVKQPGVRNAMEGGIKFYMHHLPYGSEERNAIARGQHVEYNAALDASSTRFYKFLGGQASGRKEG